MNEFTSVFAAELNEHIAIRRKVLAPQSMMIDLRVLADFDRYATGYEVKEKCVTEDLTSGWIHHLREKNHSRTVSDKVSCLRIFLEYLRYSGIPVFIPSRPKWHEDYTPYIFTNTEMENIFRAADEAEPKITRGSLTDMRFEFPMLVRLLYGCGLRLGEALSLIAGDIDFKRGLLSIRKAKNKKQRMVPMHESLTKTLAQYCAAMDITGKPNAFLFPGEKPDTHVSISTAGTKLKKILKSVNAYVPTEEPGRRGQCLHCLRHLFAVKSFAQAEENGRPTSDSVPYLSVYLGHFDMDGTEKYLKFSSDIFPEHTEMFAAYSAGVFSHLGGAE